MAVLDNAKAELYVKLQTEYFDYIKTQKANTVDDIFRNIDEISATKDVYGFIMQTGNLDGGEIEYLLSVDAPLRLLRDHWLYEKKDISESMSHAIWEICDREMDSDENIDSGEDEDEYVVPFSLPVTYEP